MQNDFKWFCFILQIMLATVEHYARVEVNGSHTRGMLAVDKGEILGKPHNIKLVTNLDVSTYETYLKWAAGDPISFSSDSGRCFQSAGRSTIKRRRIN